MAERKAKPSLKTTSFISKDLEMKGTLNLQGGIRIDGKFTGVINSESTVYIGQEAQVNAEVYTHSLVSSGRFRGKVSALDTLELHSPGSLTGEIITKNLVMEKDVFFQGRCQLLDDVSEEIPEVEELHEPRKAIQNRRG